MTTLFPNPNPNLDPATSAADASRNGSQAAQAQPAAQTPTAASAPTPSSQPPPRPWLTSYSASIPATIDDRLGGTIVEMFDVSVRRYEKAAAVESFGVQYSYARLGELANAVAAWLQSQGLGRGDQIAVMMPNVAAYLPIVFGALKAGCTVVNVNPLYTARELTHQLRDSGARTIFVLAQFEHTVKAAKAETPVDRVVRVMLGDLLGIKGMVVNYVGGKKTPVKPDGRVDGAFDFAKVIAAGRGKRVMPVSIDENDLAFLQYTGGTTGVSKGAALSHRNILANVAQCTAWFEPVVQSRNDGRQDIMVTALPLYHIFALMACCMFIVKRGGCALLITNPRDIPAFVTTLKTRRFSMISGVNTLYNALLDNPKIGEVDWKQLKVTLSGGMATQRAVAERWYKQTGQPIIEGYGLSETSPGVCFNRADNTKFSGTVGLPWPSTDVSIRGPDGVELPMGSIGELTVKGPQVMGGYWNRPDETAAVTTPDGYFRTGDLALMLPDGEIKIVDRLKEMILVSGFNVYPNEVEDVIARHPKVREAAVVGLPDGHSGEAVHAFVVARDDSLTADELKAFCATELTKYKCPKFVTFRSELPKTNVGKVLRRVLREEMMAKAV
ncbi:MAG: AMP-binding protein [Hyphomicrobium aestuarii]|nr:AMP-binding protein [Hyphomicrobium aestuarii]